MGDEWARRVGDTVAARLQGAAPGRPAGEEARDLTAAQRAEAMARVGAELIDAAAYDYLYGQNGVEKDLAKGAELLKAAGHGGHVEAQNMLGDFYLNARKGFPEDDAKAVKWYRKAVDQDDAEGQFKLGNCYQYGHGVDNDDVEAARLYRLAAEQGNADGQCQLGYCYDYGVGADQDHEEAVKWYRLAADKGDSTAQNNLAYSYQHELGVEQDYAKAAHFYQLAADQDNMGSQKQLGLLYFEGNGVQRNCDTALRWLRLSGSEEEHVTDAIAEIETSGNELLRKSTETQVTMIEAGESVFGQAQDGTGDFVLHVAARALQLDTVALFFDHAAFDDLVLRANTAGELPRDVVSTQKPLKAQTREARALRSVLSMSRRSRAACVLWCFEVLRDIAPERLIACIPRDIVREIVQHVLPPAAPGNLNCGVATLLCSPVAWPRPCLAIAPPVVPQPTSPQDVLALQQQQQQQQPQQRHQQRQQQQQQQQQPQHQQQELPAEASGGKKKRTLELAAGVDVDATRESTSDDFSSESAADEPANKRSRH